jgi:ComF family protein
MNALLQRLGTDLLHLIAPGICPSCDEPLGLDEQFYCASCRASLEPAPFPRDMYQEMVGLFPADELALSALGSLYRFEHESPVQRLIYALKYGGCYRLGVEMGRELGGALTMFDEFAGIDLVVPVPLHRSKRRERGYNQAEAIARGIREALPQVGVSHALVRTRFTPSQTTLNAQARRNNVRDAFRIAGQKLRDRIILLCDDVCTTGATLNACAEQLLAAGARKVCAATIAKDIPHREAFVVVR